MSLRHRASGRRTGILSHSAALAVVLLIACSEPRRLAVTLSPSAVTLAPGASADVAVTVQRTSVSGDVTLTTTLSGAPFGTVTGGGVGPPPEGIVLAIEPGTLSAQSTTSVLTVQAALTATGRGVVRVYAASPGVPPANQALLLTIQ